MIQLWKLSLFAAGAAMCLGLVEPVGAADKAPGGPIELFNGKNFEGWNGDVRWFRVEDGAIVAGSLKEKAIPENYFLATNSQYHDFELSLRVKLRPAAPGNPINGGIQFRSVRVYGSSEMSGYQADVGTNVWGAIYDESRRRKFLSRQPSADELKALIKADDWNDYRIVCKVDRFQTFINGKLVAEYVEENPSYAAVRGHIAVQIHAAPHPQEILYKDLRLTRLD